MAEDSLVRFPLNRRALAKQRTRLRLIAAARTLVAERGYDAATLREIAARAQVSTGAVFANFDDKADLFNEVLIDDQAALLAEMHGASGGSARGRLLAMLTAAYARQIKQPSLIQAEMGFCWSSGTELERRRRPGARQILDALSTAIADGVRTGELSSSLNTELIAEMVWDAYLSGCRHAVFDGWTAERLTDRMAARLDALLDGCRDIGDGGEVRPRTTRVVEPRASRSDADPRALRG